MMRLFLVLLAVSSLLPGQPKQLPLSNDKLEVVILDSGASISAVVLKDDPGKLNPLWQPGRRAGSGHFLCVDGFGSPSADELKAGQKYHGEAILQTFETAASDGKSITLKTRLPLLQENLTRTYRLVDGEYVLYAETELESLVAFDRPMVWGEHATIGAPFLEDLKTVVDMPVVRGQTRPYTAATAATRRFASGQDFTWPNAPQKNGKIVDIRFAPAEHDFIGHTTQLIDPSLKFGWVTALNTERRLIVGWIFNREQFPWVQSWENYPAAREKMARGLEFSTQPYDLPRREVVDMGRLFGIPTFKWLPAKTKINARWLMFYARVPENFRKVDDLKFEGGKITLHDFKSGQTVTLTASQPL